MNNDQTTTILLISILALSFLDFGTRKKDESSAMVDPALFIIRGSHEYISSPDEMRRLLIKYEGYRNCRYLDTKGIPTIGIGYNLNANVGTTKKLVGTNWPICLSDQNINKLYRFSIARATSELDARLTWARTMPSRVRDVLIRSSFNMGMGNESSGLLSFGNTLNLLKNRRFVEAARGFRMSKWCRDVKETRCHFETKIIEGAANG